MDEKDIKTVYQMMLFKLDLVGECKVLCHLRCIRESHKRRKLSAMSKCVLSNLRERLDISRKETFRYIIHASVGLNWAIS